MSVAQSVSRNVRTKGDLRRTFGGRRTRFEPGRGDDGAAVDRKTQVD